ncbi:hypothetical protein ABT332_14280 [Saccharomonospora azurea]|uniref:hypothetical protein n=1 Tax=Saccharomonospora azurea TaxID=40988 RepID=UPI0033331776
MGDVAFRGGALFHTTAALPMTACCRVDCCCADGAAGGGWASTGWCWRRSTRASIYAGVEVALVS